MLRLPLEVERRVAHWSALGDLGSMLRLDKASYLNLISLFYQNITINTTEQLDLFFAAITSDIPAIDRTPLRLLPRTLVISQANQSASPNPDTIVTILADLVRLEELQLELDMDCLDQVFALGQLIQVSFKLKRFCCPLLAGSGFRSFLQHQTTIECLDIMDKSGLRALDLFEHEAIDHTFLPKLRELTSGAEAVSKIVPGRPVSIIHSTHFFESIGISSITDALSRSSAPLNALCATTFLRELSKFENFIFRWLHGLEYASYSLERIEFRFIATPVLYMMSSDRSVRVSVDELSLTAALQPFKMLRKFIIESSSSRLPPPNIVIDAPFLTLPNFWKDACPSLRVVSLFGNEIAIE
ncbi:hypothetical protein RhiJN_20848 [Ceratobasidium sp. AG-Ba]|nr:hypothetical protein RhiJN_20848 [Ceratobasidium sp. AG-Ba]